MATTAKRAPQFFDVPAGTRPVTCKSCPFTVYFIVTASGKRMPVDTSVEGGRTPTPTSAGVGVSHFVTCAQADQHRKAR